MGESGVISYVSFDGLPLEPEMFSPHWPDDGPVQSVVTSRTSRTQATARSMTVFAPYAGVAMKPYARPTRVIDGVDVPICLFCGVPLPTRRSKSKEHLLARSWSDKLDRAEVQYFAHGWQIDAEGQRREERDTVAAPFARTLPVVCHRCNNGWMSRLEDRAVPILWAVAQGKEAVLDRADLRVVNQWMAKSAVVLEANDDAAKGWSHEFNRSVMDSAVDNTDPGSFATWIFRLEPNELVRLRTIIGFLTLQHPSGSRDHIYRVSLVQIHQVAMISVHSGDWLAWSQIATALIALDIRPVCGLDGRGAFEELHLEATPSLTPSAVNRLADELVEKLIAARASSRPNPSADT
jgi:hypothetical protein